MVLIIHINSVAENQTLCFFWSRFLWLSFSRLHTFAHVKWFYCSSLFPPLTTSSSVLHFLSLSSSVLFSSRGPSSTPPHSSSSSPLPPLLCLARRHSCPAYQVQHMCQCHRQVGFYSPPWSSAEGADSALCSAIGPWSRSHYEEPGGTDAAGFGNGTKGFLKDLSSHPHLFILKTSHMLGVMSVTSVYIWLVVVNSSESGALWGKFR